MDKYLNVTFRNSITEYFKYLPILANLYIIVLITAQAHLVTFHSSSTFRPHLIKASSAPPPMFLTALSAQVAFWLELCYMEFQFPFL